MASASPSFDLQAFCGVFKRVLSTRLLDTLSPAPDNNMIVCVDRVPEEIADRRRTGAGRKQYRWSFGPSVDTARVGYLVEVLSDAVPGGADLGGLTPLRISFKGRDCYGMYQADVGTLTIHLTGSTNATLVYKLLDEDTVSVAITEVPPAAQRSAPKIQVRLSSCWRTSVLFASTPVSPAHALPALTSS